MASFTAEDDIVEETEIADLLKVDFLPEKEIDNVESSNSNQQKLERAYYFLKRTKGPEDLLTIEMFLKLFSVWIGMYRLNKCDAELAIILPHIPKSHSHYVKIIQALAFTRWKQSRFQEAISLFLEMETIVGQSAALAENIGHTYNSMGDYENAEKYFSLALSSMDENDPKSNRGGVLLGLGLLLDRTGKTLEGLEKCKDALAWYEARSSSAGDGPSSLEAKASGSIAKLHFKMDEFEEARAYATKSVDIFVQTCGHDSPLVAGAAKTLGEILLRQGKVEEALSQLKCAYTIEATKDSIQILTLMEVNNLVVDAIASLNETHRYQEFLAVGLQACTSIRNHLPQDGNAAVFYKLIAELAIRATEFRTAAGLLHDAIPLLINEKSMDCSNLVDQCQQYMNGIKSILANREG